ncbi:GGDEF domain-containing protein [Paracoccus beibuensis]|uniref:GGDEF domain-containing protein n=1 Tax=Paracoccus beibuensis TaxID=547602 RepID=UPI00223F8470|nr:GGDEF domain-containing protein [Paracoccus beibuensis]
MSMAGKSCLVRGAALAQLLPMHLWLRDDGTVISAGPTLAKLLPDLDAGLVGRLSGARPGEPADPMTAIRGAVDGRRRLFLRVEPESRLVLRGHGVRVFDGSLLLNLGFGIGLHHAIRQAGLTDADFAPSDLAMELLFLHEANRGVLMELSRFNEQLAESRASALKQAQTDPLTGLGNRRKLDLTLSSALKPSETGDIRPFALVHLDLDNFKQVNDRLGHQAGDDLLRAVGKVLRDQIRRADTATRIGGDEFVLLLPGMISRPALEQLSGRIITAINALTPSQLSGPPVSTSLGIIIWPTDGAEHPDEVLALADEALYASKRSGRSRATIR